MGLNRVFAGDLGIPGIVSLVLPCEVMSRIYPCLAIIV